MNAVVIHLYTSDIIEIPFYCTEDFDFSPFANNTFAVVTYRVFVVPQAGAAAG